MRRTTLGLAAIVLGATLVWAPTASPVGEKRGDVRVAGVCTKASTSKLKLSDEDGRIEVEFEVDQNRNGVRWTVAVLHNGKRVARLTRVTRPPSGSFEARLLRANTSGADRFTARATSPTGEVCTARATFTS